MSEGKSEEHGYVFSDNDPEVTALVRHEPKDGLIYIHFNQTIHGKREDVIIFPEQKGSTYAIYVSGVGGLNVGEAKKVPVFDGWCILGDDETIYCGKLVDDGASSPLLWEVVPSSSGYEARRSSLELDAAGDTRLFRGREPLPRAGA